MRLSERPTLFEFEIKALHVCARRHVGDFCLLHSKRVALCYDDDELGGLFEIPICATPATAFLDGVSTCIWDGKGMKCGALSDFTIWAGMKALVHHEENGSGSMLDGLTECLP